MASLLNADDGVVSGSAGLKSTADSSGVLALQTNGTTAITVNTSQNVGIGTSSPSYKLTVYNGAAVFQNAETGTGTDNGFFVGNSTASTAYVWNFENYPILFGTNNAEKMRLDTSGNLGLGVTPSASTLSGIIEGGYGTFGLTSSVGVALAGNAYYNSGWKYKASSTATLQLQDSGGIKWNIAASGTAGNAISFTQAMTLLTSGNFTVGYTDANILGGTARIGAYNYNSNCTIAAVGGNYTAANYGQLYLTGGFGDGGTRTSGFFIRSQAVGGGGGIVNNLLFVAQTSNGGSEVEYARFDSSGNLLVGTTTVNPHSSGTYGVQINKPNGIVIGVDNSHAIIAARWNGNGEVIRLQRDNTDVGSIDVTTTATSYNTSSDYRLKNTIAPMTGALAKVALLKPCTYKWNVDGSDGQGFIAHELAEVCPDAVVGEKDAVDANGNPEYQGVDTSFLVATLTAAIQEQQALIQQLQADVAILKGSQQ